MLPVANPRTNGSFVFSLFDFMASRIYSATFFEAYALVGKNLGSIFSIKENLGKVDRVPNVCFSGTVGSTFSIL